MAKSRNGRSSFRKGGKGHPSGAGRRKSVGKAPSPWKGSKRGGIRA